MAQTDMVGSMGDGMSGTDLKKKCFSKRSQDPFSSDILLCKLGVRKVGRTPLDSNSGIVLCCVPGKINTFS